MGKLHYRESPSEKERQAFSKFLAEDEELILATGLGAAYIRSRFMVGIFFPGIIFMGIGLILAYFLQFNLGVGLLLGMFIAIGFSALRALHIFHAHRYLLTTRRVIIKHGIFAVKITAALYDKITHIEVEQGFMDRILLHYGKIIINTAGMNKGEITLEYVGYPIEFKNLLERLINREREQSGGRFGPVVTLEGEVV